MKRLLSVFAVLFIMPFAVTANSGPATWHSSPISESYNVDEDSQIEVLSEQLTFEMPYEPTGEKIINLHTTAIYEMHNTSLEEELMTMAFPFVARMIEVSKEDILITATDNLNGFTQTIKNVFPESKTQICVVHQIRNACRYVVWKDKKAFTTDMKLIYNAPTQVGLTIFNRT